MCMHFLLDLPLEYDFFYPLIEENTRITQAHNP